MQVWDNDESLTSGLQTYQRDSEDVGTYLAMWSYHQGKLRITLC